MASLDPQSSAAPTPSALALRRAAASFQPILIPTPAIHLLEQVVNLLSSWGPWGLPRAALE